MLLYRTAGMRIAPYVVIWLPSCNCNCATLRLFIEWNQDFFGSRLKNVNYNFQRGGHISPSCFRRFLYPGRIRIWKCFFSSTQVSLLAFLSPFFRFLICVNNTQTLAMLRMIKNKATKLREIVKDWNIDSSNHSDVFCKFETTKLHLYN